MSDRTKTGYLLEDYRIFYNADRKMKVIPLHYHDFHKIVILLAGNTSYMIEGRSYDLLPGDMVLVRAGAMHRPVVHDSSLYERIIIYISPFFAPWPLQEAGSVSRNPAAPDGLNSPAAPISGSDPVLDLFSSGSLPVGISAPAADPSPGMNPGFDPVLPLRENGKSPTFRELVRPNKEAAGSFTELFRQLKGLAQESTAAGASAPGLPYASGLYGRIKTAELMILLMRCIRGDQFLPAGSASSGSMAEQIMAFIRENLSDPDLCVDLVADHVCLNRSYLMHYFREQTGYTIGNYITEKRLFQARSLILKGESYTSACYACGFGSYSSFYRAYSKRYGTSPAGRPQDNTKRDGTNAASLSSVIAE